MMEHFPNQKSGSANPPPLSSALRLPANVAPIVELVPPPLAPLFESAWRLDPDFSFSIMKIPRYFFDNETVILVKNI